MSRRTPHFVFLAVLFVVAVTITGVDRAKAAPNRDSSASECEPGTIASYLGTTCALPPAVYHWVSYECTSTPSNICNRLGKNGEEIHVRRDPNGPNTLLVGGTDRWNVKAGESIHVVIRGTVYGASGNITWPHFHQQRASTGDGYEENITKVDCGENCIGEHNGSSAFRCDASSPDENCNEQHRIAAYMHNAARFNPAPPDKPYPFTIEVKMSGGTNGSASLRSLGLHISAVGQGGGNRGGFQGRRRPF
jgi:hypothetical protein